MPRNPQGQYSLPAGSIVAIGEDILPSQHNPPLQDIAQDLNNARPIASGGTGATSATDARTNLGLGTAATADVTTSATDTTAGRIPRVGWLGLAGQAPAYDADPNEIPLITTPFALSNLDSLNKPASRRFSGLRVMRAAVSGVDIILAADSGFTEPRVFTRAITSGGFQPWREMYHTGNLVGTVSQSGGEVDGAVFERDSNDDGEYVRFAEGTQICWRDATTPESTEFNETYDYAASFNASHPISGGHAMTGDQMIAPGFPNRLRISHSLEFAATSFSWRLRLHSSVTGMHTTEPSAEEVTFTMFSIGRWF